MSNTPHWPPLRVDSEDVRPLAPHEFEQFRKLAHRSFGLDLKPGKEDLVSARLRRLVLRAGVQTYQDYYHHVIHDSTGKALARMIDALATNHTSFLREADHFNFLRREAAPMLAGRGTIDIWCAACSTGEEVWTLAFVLNDLFPSRRIRITATDISCKALEHAERAVYPTERCGSLPAEWLTRYLAPEPGPVPSMRVVSRIRAQAIFRRLNLVEPFPGSRSYPVIFCRNVMIYFDVATQAAVVSHLADCLEAGGYLFVGHAESLNRASHGLEYVQPAIYRKPKQKENKWNRS